MQPDNAREYEFVRHEMDALKSCITTYVGFVLAGVGAAIFGITAIALNTSNLPLSICSAFVLGFILNLVLRTLMYKFNSHNRFTGYCSALGYEWFNDPKDDNKVLPILWEVAMGRLRRSDYIPLILSHVGRLGLNPTQAKDLQEVLDFYTKKPGGWLRKRLRIVRRFLRGICLLVKAIVGFSGTRSWGFPPVVVATFLLLSSGLVAIGMVIALKPELLVRLNPEAPLYLPPSIRTVAWFAFGIHVAMWMRTITKFYDLMSGESTTGAYAWRFLIIRLDLVAAHRLNPSYPFVVPELEAEIAWIRDCKKNWWKCWM